MLVNYLVKFAEEKVWLGLNMTIAVDWDVEPQTILFSVEAIMFQRRRIIIWQTYLKISWILLPNIYADMAVLSTGSLFLEKSK